MAGMVLTAFAGIAPRKGAALLQINEAQTAENTKLFSGELRSWSKPGQLAAPAFLQDDVLSIYKHTTSGGDDHWLSWSTDVNVVPSPVYATGEYPIFYTGDGSPKKTNAMMSVTGTGPFYPGAFLEMGIPFPTVAPTVSTEGGSGSPETRVYLYTFISLFGSTEEESAPSPASETVAMNFGGSVTVSNLPSVGPTGNYNVQKIRIYRSVTGTSSTTFLKVIDVDIGTTSYTDSLSATALGGVLPSTGWTPPPDDLQGIVAMANGIMAGFRGNEIFLSEPFLPHAWPAQYALTVEFEIVGIAALGESLVIATKGNPFIISGTTPSAMSQAKLPLYEPCVSKRSIASDEGGALYASPNGVVKVSTAFSGNSTRVLFTRDEWQRYNPSSMLGAVIDGRYHLFCENELLQFRGSLILDRNEAASPLTTTTMFTTAAHVEPVSANLFVAVEGQVNQWDGSATEFLPYEWVSKLFILPRPLNFGAAQIDADYGDIEVAQALEMRRQQLIAANQAIWDSGVNLLSSIGSRGPISTGLVGGSILAVLSPEGIDARYVLLTVFCNGEQIAAIPVINANAFRLPSGFKGDRWEFQINGNVPLRHLKVAETSKGLVDV